jgi:beta-glucosidase
MPTTTRRHFLASSAAGLAVLTGCTDKPGDKGAAPVRGPHFAEFDQQVSQLLSQMSLEEKIGQMTQPDQQFLKSLDDIEKYHLGSLLSGGDSDPKTGNDFNSWRTMVDRYQERALKTRLRIPLVYGVDAVHGHNNVIGATVFPQNIGLGCTRNEKLVEEASRITAIEVRATGINWTFAPCVAVPQDIRWGRTYEGYSESPDIVKTLGLASLRGLQHGGLNNPLSVLGCSKHYVGDGGTVFGTGMKKDPKKEDRHPLDQGDVRLDEATLRRLHMQGYLTTIEAGVGTIMPSYSSWNGEKCSGSKRLLQEILKDELGFRGFLISDYAAINQLPGDYRAQVQLSINAGMDMVMVPEKYEEFFNTLKALASDGGVPMTRIDDAVSRILRVKFAMGLMDPQRNHLADRFLESRFGSAEHRQVARQCVRESVVLLKNNNNVLPLAKNAARIHFAGKNADDIGNQCGGWTITWQGKSGPTTQGTTVLGAARKAVAQGTQVTYSRDGSGAAGATVGVAVIGETPYAEMNGDRTDLSLAAEDVAAVDAMKRAGIPVVVVLISGRPIMLEAILEKADAIVAAWQPGTEGDGVTDVLFGDYKPTGKLSFTWPKKESTSLMSGDSGYRALWALGYGLSY